MRQKVLKVFANPSRIFFVPYNLAVLNFIVQFIIFIIFFIVTIIFTNGKKTLDPLIFLISVCLVHTFMAYFSKKEQQIAQIIKVKLNLFKLKIPNKLNA